LRITASSWTLPLSFTAASVVALGLPGTMLYLKQREGSLPLGLVAFLSIFLLIGLGLAYAAFREFARLLRYGTWAIEIADEGGRLGQPLAVRVLPAKPVTATGDVKLTLACLEQRTTKSYGSGGTQSKTKLHTLGTFDTTVPAPQAQLQTAQPFTASIKVPQGLPPTGREGNDTVSWQLTVDVPTADGDVQAVFVVPVRGAGA
jgi:hypothetical protein